MSPGNGMKHIIIANMNVKLYSWRCIFRKVVRQQIWGEVLVLIQASSTDPFWTYHWKIMIIGRSAFTKVIVKIKLAKTDFDN